MRKHKLAVILWYVAWTVTSIAMSSGLIALLGSIINGNPNYYFYW